MKLKLFLLFATVAMFTAFVRREPNPWPEAWQAAEKLLLIHSRLWYEKALRGADQQRSVTCLRITVWHVVTA
jgi:hypothetical protein